MSKKIPCEIYSRIVGYFRPLSNWNLGKKSEFRDREEYEIKHTISIEPIKVTSAD